MEVLDLVRRCGKWPHSFVFGYLMYEYWISIDMGLP